MSANEKQVGGSHYRAAFQHWDFTILVLGNRYLEGNLTKYATRWRRKNGTADLDKALHYLDKIVELFEAGMLPPPISSPVDQIVLVRRFAAANNLMYSEAEVCRVAAFWNDRDDLAYLRSQLESLRAEAVRLQERRDAETREGFEDG